MLNLIAGVNEDIGVITPPAGVVPGDPGTVIPNLIRSGITLLLIVSFIIFLIWTILAGLRFIFAQGDSKTVGQAWSSIYWSLIGMVVVVGAFAIIKLVETFFNISILTGGGITIPGT